jgi:ATP-dependent Lon protease
VGGIKEKVIAAHRAGLTRLLIPKKNQPDLAEVPEEIRNQFSFVLVETIEDVLHHVLSFDTKPWMSQTAAA